MNVVCCIDDNYVVYCGVMLTSLLENNKDIEFTIHIITSELTNENRDSLYNIVEKRYGQVLKIHDISERKFPIRPGDHVSLATYYRILLPEILDDISKVLYLDSDLVIDRSIKDLLQIDFDAYAIAAVIDVDSSNESTYKRLSYDKELKYFNAGVLLMNLDYWRSHKVMERTIDYISHNQDILLYHDQDALNYILKHEKKLLPLKYNFQEKFYLKSPVLPTEYFFELKESFAYKAIIHYNGKDKPWYKECCHPDKCLFYKYLHMTKWGCLKPKYRLKGLNLFKYIVSKNLLKLGLKKRSNSMIVDPVDLIVG